MRGLLLIVPLAILGGCVVRAGPAYYRPYQPPPPSAPMAEVYYYGQHFIPESAGGGWCYIDGPHTHAYYPDHDDWYEYDQGYYWYRGPFVFTFFGGHPLPGGGWCFINGVHQHDYPPPHGSDWRWSRGAYVYEGQYRPFRPPPASYWPRPAPRFDWRENRPSVRPSPMRPRPNDRVFPARGFQRQEPERRPPPGWNDRGASGFAPGRSDNPPPGQGGIPPGQYRPEPERRGPGFLPPTREDDRPGASGFAPGRGGNLPPGQGGIPPGQVRPEPEPQRGAPVWDRGGPAREDRPGSSGFAPGRGDNLPPGQGGIPPGQVRPEPERRGGPGFTTPGRDDRGPVREPPRVDRPATPQPSSPPPREEKRDKEKEKRDRDEKSDGPAPGRGWRR